MMRCALALAAALAFAASSGAIACEWSKSKTAQSTAPDQTVYAPQGQPATDKTGG